MIEHRKPFRTEHFHVYKMGQGKEVFLDGKRVFLDGKRGKPKVNQGVLEAAIFKGSSLADFYIFFSGT
tara:strand:- start:34 stop:237 length:204 start_codon:yes stop_codon:yes gene_type:complete